MKRETASVLVSGLGLIILAYAVLSLYLVASIPESKFPSQDERLAAIIGRTALPAGMGFFLFFAGVFAYFAAPVSYAPLGLAALAWLYATYSLHATGAVAKSTDLTAYVPNVILPLVVSTLLASAGAFLSIRALFMRVAELEASLEELGEKKELEAKREEERKQRPFLVKE